MSKLLTKTPKRNKIRFRMRYLFWMALGAIMLSHTAVNAQGVGLSGTIKVCSSCAYTSPQQVMDSLIWNGVSGPVTVKIVAGDYGPVRVDFSIINTSATNTVSFEGAGTSGSSVTRIKSSVDTTLSLSYCSYISFKNIKFQNTGISPGWPVNFYVAYMYGCSNISFENCLFQARDNLGSAFDPWETFNVYEESCYTSRYSKCRFYGGNSPYFSLYNSGSRMENSRLTNGFSYNYYVGSGEANVLTNSVLDSIQQYGGGNSYASDYEDADTVTDNQMYTGSPTVYVGQSNLNNNAYPFLFSNNMIYDISDPSYSLMYVSWGNTASTNVNLKILHNSFYSTKANAICLQMDNSSFTTADHSGHGFTVANNNFFAGSALTDPVVVYSSNIDASQGDVIEGNNYYTQGSGPYGFIQGTFYNSFADLRAKEKSKGLGQFEHNLATSYVSATDLHYTSSSLLPSGKNVGINVDIDGDSRCGLFATAGADEGKPTWSKPTAAFSGPKNKIVEGYPTDFKNAASEDDPEYYRWYVNGKFVTDSIQLTTRDFSYPSVSVALVAISCGGKDSLVKTFAVDTPKKAPTSDFIADKNNIKSGEIVQFNDLSLNYPSEWSWEVSPKISFPGGVATTAYAYVQNDSTQPSNAVRFDVPGKYKVCLTTKNRVGSGGTECKTDYISVLGSYRVSTGTTTITDTKGYLYDDGGPDLPYTAYYNKTQYQALIAPACAKKVYLIFNYFDLWCGDDFLRIWDGGTAGGKASEITTCTANTYNGNGPGLTGGPSFSCWTPSITCVPKTTDTFVANSGKMFIQMTVNGGSPAKGFEAYFWSDIRPAGPPTASFQADTTACTNANIDLTSTTQGSDLTYAWFLNDDYSYPIDDRPNTNYAFLFPGDYDVSLVAYSCSSSDTMVKTIHVTDPPTPKSDFIADNTDPTTNDIVYLTPNIKQCVDDYTWTITKKTGITKVTYVNGTNNTSAMPAVILQDTGCYDVKLRVSNATGMDSITKTCYLSVKKPYCIPELTHAVLDLGISEVKLNTIDNKSDQTGGYENYTPTVSTNLEIGVSYPVTISRNTSANSAIRTVYIDWNGDGDFSDANETVATETSGRALSWTDTITVPAYAKLGATVMRIAITQGSQTNDPCSNDYGEYEDYRIYISQDRTKPIITLNGADTITVEQGYAFSDPGATAYDNLSGNVTSKIVVSSSEVTTGSSFDILTPGTYIFSYDVTDGAGNAADTRKRVVIVTPDKTKPDLEVNSADTVIIGVFTSFTPPTYTANDLVDGNVTSDVQTNIHVDVNTVGTDTLHYSVTDQSGNTATKDIIVYVVDTTAPSLALKGKAVVYVDVNTAYTDSGVVYSDNYYKGTLWDAALLKGMDTTGSVDVTKLGTYSISYTLTDPSGNKSITVNRTVIVQDTTAPHVVLKGDNNFMLDVNTAYADQGISITDNYYKQFTIDTEGTFYTKFPNGNATKLGTYTVIYKVTDGSNNVTTITRTINVVDRIAPVVVLKGEPGVSVCRWDTLIDAGYTVTDNYYTGSGITVTMEGSYTTKHTQEPIDVYLRYKAVDSSGNVGYSDWRTINVRECASGIQNVSNLDKSISIYPNPSEGLFSISADIAQQQEVKITVTNMLGQQIAVLNNQVLGNNQIQIDLRGQSAGVYLLNIYTDSQVVTKRITITR